MSSHDSAQSEALIAVPLLDRVAKSVASVGNAIGGAVLVAMMLLTAVDVFMRYVLNKPILGGIELTQFIMSIIVAIGLAERALYRGHITVDFFIKKFSPRVQAVFNSTTSIISLGVFVVITWYSIVFAEHLREGSNVSVALFIPIYPFVYIIALGAAVLSLVLLSNTVQYLSHVIKGYSRLALVGIFILIVVILAVVAGPLWGRALWQMSPLSAGILGTVALIVVIFSGMPIGNVMALIGFLGMAYISGIGAGLGIMGTTPYATSASYTTSVIPLFVLMGAFCFYSGLSRELYLSAYRWIGHLPGGLAMATIGACTAFAAVTGSSVATATTIGTVALPEMKKYKYDSALATGCVAAGGTLGILIPPSIPLVIYGILTEQSIGKLFLAGFIPGILVAIFYIVTIFIVCKRNPLYGMPGPASNLKEKVVSLKGIWGIALLFVLVIGGMYAGVFTATEAAGIGAFGAFLFAMSTRTLSWHSFVSSLKEAGAVTGMATLILIGGVLFGYFLVVTRLPFQLATIIAELQINRYLILVVIIVVYLFLGCIMSALEMIIITVPVFFPVVVAIGFDPIWFGILMTRLVEIGQVTPPVGINVFVIQGVAKDVPMYTIFRGIFPFLISDIINLVVLVAIPEIVLFIPNMMK